MYSQNVSVLFLVAIGLMTSYGFFVGRQNELARANGMEIDEECLAKADAGSCEFYTCFERRLPCGRDWYMLKQGLFYCNKIERMMDAFPEQAQNFLRDSQTCLMQSLKDVYREEHISCHDLEHQAIEAIPRCFSDNAFCSNLRGNYAEFVNIYEVDDLFSSGAGKVWRVIANLAVHCGGEEVTNIAANVQRHLQTFANSAEDVLTDAGETIADAVGDAAESVRSRLSDLFSW